MKRGKIGWNLIGKELRHHMPLTFAVSLIAGILVGILYLNNFLNTEIMRASFEIFHPTHVLFSGAATASIYFKYKKDFFGSVFVGVLGAIVIGSISDVLFPFLSGQLFGLETELHLPIIEESFLILGAALIGSSLGKYPKIFLTSHSLHIFISVFASLSYILAFSININPLSLGVISLIVFFVVYIPCCISDIVFPLLFVKRVK